MHLVALWCSASVMVHPLALLCSFGRGGQHLLIPLLFGLFFDHIVAHIESTLHPSDIVTIANMAVWAALYTNDVVLMSPNVSGLTC